MKNVLIIGGTSGLGWALANELANDDQIQNVYIVGRTLHTEVENPKIIFFAHNLLMDNFNFSERFNDIDALFITIGAGRVAKFDNLSEKEINMEININYKAVATVLKQFYPRIQKSNDFKVAVISSIAGMINSPLFSVYGASKAAIMALIQSLNIELEKDGSNNRILDVRPGHIAGTRFANNKAIDTKPAQKVAVEIITAVQKKDQILIPGYEETYKAVIERNREDSQEFGINSYD